MNNIASIRKRLNISQADLAKHIQSSTSRIGNFESDIRTPGISTCWEIVNALKSFGADVQFEDVFPNTKEDTAS